MTRTADRDLSRFAAAAGVMVIIAGCLAVYMLAIKGDFIWDDNDYVTENPLLTEPGGLYRIWFSTDIPSQYFPMTYTTFWIEYRLWGLNPMGYHIVNVAIHIANALLLWLVLTRLSIPGGVACIDIICITPRAGRIGGVDNRTKKRPDAAVFTSFGFMLGGICFQK